MHHATQLAYVQARLQARHGRRPDGATWQRLVNSGDLGHCLEVARRTPLRRWVAHLTGSRDSHGIEAALRQELRAYVAEVAAWQPPGWRPAVLWAATLPDLPLIDHLLSAQAPPAWLPQEPALRGLMAGRQRDRVSALAASAFAPLLPFWDKGLPLARAWGEHWRSLWPSMPRSHARSLEALASLLAGHRAEMAAGVDGGAARAYLARRVEHLFRRHPQQPAAVFCHLVLVGLDVEQLRGLLARRALLPGRSVSETAGGPSCR
jgi:hypothetical protein